MANTKKHIYTGDIVAIFLCLIMAVYSGFIYKSNCLPFLLYYVVMFLFRIIVLVLEVVIVRKHDEALTKFKKERFLCRIAGVLLLAVDMAFMFILFYGPLMKSYEIYEKFPWLLAVYGVYATYKLVSAILGFRKARRSFSPYRDIMSSLSCIDALVTFMTLIAFILQLFVDLKTNDIAFIVFFYVFILMVIISLVITIKVIVSRKIPNLLK